MNDASSNTTGRIIFRLNMPLRVIACITLIAFLFTTIPADLTWAAQASTRAIYNNDDITGSSAIDIPRDLGTVIDRWSPAAIARDTRTIIHIQDAHCNYAAQKKISDILSYLNSAYRIQAINLEGGEGAYDLSPFTNIADTESRGKVADLFVREGLVNGAEYFAVNNPDKVKLWGIEDGGLYLDNLHVYRNSRSNCEAADRHLKTLSRVLTELKIRIYPKRLLELDTKYTQYKAGNLDLKDYITYLLAVARSESLDISSLKDLDMLRRSLEQESQIDFRKANTERDRLIDILQKALSRREVEEMVVKTVEFRTGRLTQKEFYAYLTKMGRDIGADMSQFAGLEKYLAYVSLYSRIDNSRAMTDIDALDSRLKERFCENDTQRQLLRLSKNLALLKNIFTISLTKSDYEYYMASRASFDVKEYLAFINREASFRGIAVELDKDIESLDRYRAEMEKFYEYSLKRDEAFVRNIRFTSHKPRATSDEPQVAIVITGGFHTDNLSELFKKNSISYITIMPNFKNDKGYESPYMKLLSGNPYAQFVKTAQSQGLFALAIASNLNPLGRKAAGIAQPLNEEVSGTTIVPVAAPQEAVSTAAQSVYRPVYDYYDLKDTPISIVYNSAWSGRYYVNREIEGPDKMFLDGKIIGKRPIVPVSDLLQPLKGLSTVAYSADNYMHNDWFIIYDGDLNRIFSREGEPLYERTYTMFVIWKDGSVSSEDVSFAERNGKISAIINGRDRSSRIRSALFGQRVVHNGRSVPLETENLYNQFDDLYHLYHLPQFVEYKDGKTVYGPSLCHNDLFVGLPAPGRAIDRQKLLDVIKASGYIEVDLAPFLKAYSIQDVKDKALLARGYREKESGILEEGEFRIEADVLKVRLIRSKYPHNLIGITSSGKVVAINLTGDKSKGIGYRVDELGDTIIQETKQRGDPVVEAFLLANSRDVNKYVNGELVREESSANPYEGSSALVVFSRPKDDRAVSHDGTPAASPADKKGFHATVTKDVTGTGWVIKILDNRDPAINARSKEAYEEAERRGFIEDHLTPPFNIYYHIGAKGMTMIKQQTAIDLEGVARDLAGMRNEPALESLASFLVMLYVEILDKKAYVEDYKVSPLLRNFGIYGDSLVILDIPNLKFEPIGAFAREFNASRKQELVSEFETHLREEIRQLRATATGRESHSLTARYLLRIPVIGTILAYMTVYSHEFFHALADGFRGRIEIERRAGRIVSARYVSIEGGSFRQPLKVLMAAPVGMALSAMLIFAYLMGDMPFLSDLLADTPTMLSAVKVILAIVANCFTFDVFVNILSRDELSDGVQAKQLLDREEYGLDTAVREAHEAGSASSLQDVPAGNVPERVKTEAVKESARKVAELFESGLDREDEAIGVHGTSIEAIMYLAEHGKLPPGARTPGEFYYYPLGKGFDAVDRAKKIYADWNVMKYYISSKLPFKLDKGLYEELSQFILLNGDSKEDYPKLLRMCNRHGITERQLSAWGEEARSQGRKGVVILLSKDILKDGYKVSEDKTGSDDNEARFSIKRGLPLKYIIGIEPVGNYEYKKLEELQNKVRKAVPPADAPVVHSFLATAGDGKISLLLSSSSLPRRILGKILFDLSSIRKALVLGSTAPHELGHAIWAYTTWQSPKKVWRGILTGDIEEIYDEAERYGGISGNVLAAMLAGFVILCHPGGAFSFLNNLAVYFAVINVISIAVEAVALLFGYGDLSAESIEFIKDDNPALRRLVKEARSHFGLNERALVRLADWQEIVPANPKYAERLAAYLSNRRLTRDDWIDLVNYLVSYDEVKREGVLTRENPSLEKLVQDFDLTHSHVIQCGAHNKAHLQFLARVIARDRNVADLSSSARRIGLEGAIASQDRIAHMYGLSAVADIAKDRPDVLEAVKQKVLSYKDEIESRLKEIDHMFVQYGGVKKGYDASAIKQAVTSFFWDLENGRSDPDGFAKALYSMTFATADADAACEPLMGMTINQYLVHRNQLLSDSTVVASAAAPVSVNMTAAQSLEYFIRNTPLGTRGEGDRWGPYVRMEHVMNVARDIDAIAARDAQAFNVNPYIKPGTEKTLDARTFARICDLYASLDQQHRDALAIAAALHDYAKLFVTNPDKHGPIGATMVEPELRRMGYDEAMIELVKGLIAYHGEPWEYSEGAKNNFGPKTTDRQFLAALAILGIADIHSSGNRPIDSARAAKYFAPAKGFISYIKTLIVALLIMILPSFALTTAMAGAGDAGYAFSPTRGMEGPAQSWRDKETFIFSPETWQDEGSFFADYYKDNVLKGGFETSWLKLISQDWLAQRWREYIPSYTNHVYLIDLTYLLPEKARGRYEIGYMDFDRGQYPYSVFRPSPFYGYAYEFKQDHWAAPLTYSFGKSHYDFDPLSYAAYPVTVNYDFFNMFKNTPIHTNMDARVESEYFNIGKSVLLGDNLVASAYIGQDYWRVPEIELSYTDENGKKVYYDDNKQTSIGGNVIYYYSPAHRMRAFYDVRHGRLIEDEYWQSVGTNRLSYAAGLDWTWLGENSAYYTGLMYEENGMSSDAKLSLGYAQDSYGVNLTPFVSLSKKDFLPDKKGIIAKYLYSPSEDLDLGVSLSYTRLTDLTDRPEEEYAGMITLNMRFGAHGKGVPLRASGSAGVYYDTSLSEDFTSEALTKRLSESAPLKTGESVLRDSPTLEKFIQNLSDAVNTEGDVLDIIAALYGSANDYNHSGDRIITADPGEMYAAIRQSYFDHEQRLVNICAGFAQLYADIINRVSREKGLDIRAVPTGVKVNAGHVVVAVLTKDGYVIMDYGRTMATHTHNLEDALSIYQAVRGSLVLDHHVYDPDRNGKQIGSIETREGKAIRQNLTLFDGERRYKHIETFLDAAERKARHSMASDEARSLTAQYLSQIPVIGNFLALMTVYPHEFFHALADGFRGRIEIERAGGRIVSARYVSIKGESFRRPLTVLMAAPVGMALSAMLLFAFLMAGMPFLSDLLADMPAMLAVVNVIINIVAHCFTFDVFVNILSRDERSDGVQAKDLIDREEYGLDTAVREAHEAGSASSLQDVPAGNVPERVKTEAVKESARKVAELFESGLDREDEAIGVHGTSIEAIMYLAEHGKLPPGARTPGEFYYYPLGKGFDAVDRAKKIYADWNVMKYYISSKLPFKLDKGLYEELSQFILLNGDSKEDYPKLLRMCNRHGITERQLSAWGEEARSQGRKGVVILLSKDILKDGYKVSEDKTGSDDNEARFSIKRGLPLKYIIGIEPVGNYEYKKLEELQNKVRKAVPPADAVKLAMALHPGQGMGSAETAHAQQRVSLNTDTFIPDIAKALDGLPKLGDRDARRSAAKKICALVANKGDKLTIDDIRLVLDLSGEYTAELNMRFDLQSAVPRAPPASKKSALTKGSASLKIIITSAVIAAVSAIAAFVAVPYIRVEKEYRALIEHRKQTERLVGALPSSLAVIGAERYSITWHGAQMEVIGGAHGAPQGADEMLKASRVILKDPQNWVFVLEGVPDARKYLNSVLAPDLAIADKLSRDYGIPVEDIIPVQGDPDVIDILVKKLGLTKQDIIAASMYPQLHDHYSILTKMLVAQGVSRGQEPSFRDSLNIYLRSARVLYGMPDRDLEKILLDTAAKIAASPEALKEFYAMTVLIRTEMLNARNTVAQTRLDALLRKYPGKKILLMIGGNHVPVVGLDRNRFMKDVTPVRIEDIEWLGQYLIENARYEKQKMGNDGAKGPFRAKFNIIALMPIFLVYMYNAQIDFLPFLSMIFMSIALAFMVHESTHFIVARSVGADGVTMGRDPATGLSVQFGFPKGTPDVAKKLIKIIAAPYLVHFIIFIAAEAIARLLLPFDSPVGYFLSFYAYLNLGLAALPVGWDGAVLSRLIFSERYRRAAQRVADRGEMDYYDAISALPRPGFGMIASDLVLKAVTVAATIFYFAVGPDIARRALDQQEIKGGVELIDEAGIPEDSEQPFLWPGREGEGPVPVEEEHREPAPVKDRFRKTLDPGIIDEALLLAHISRESRNDPCAVSESGAVGLMQLLPDAAKEMGLKINPKWQVQLQRAIKVIKYQNIRNGRKRWQPGRDGEKALMLAAWNFIDRHGAELRLDPAEYDPKHPKAWVANVDERYDREKNAAAGRKYTMQLYTRHYGWVEVREERLKFALAAYLKGPGNVNGDIRDAARIHGPIRLFDDVYAGYSNTYKYVYHIYDKGKRWSFMVEQGQDVEGIDWLRSLLSEEEHREAGVSKVSAEGSGAIHGKEMSQADIAVIIGDIEENCRVLSNDETSTMRVRLKSLLGKVDSADIDARIRSRVKAKIREILADVHNGKIVTYSPRAGIRSPTQFVLGCVLGKGKNASVALVSGTFYELSDPAFVEEMLLHEILVMLYPEESHADHKARYASAETLPEGFSSPLAGVQRAVFGMENPLKPALRNYITQKSLEAEGRMTAETLMSEYVRDLAHLVEASEDRIARFSTQPMPFDVTLNEDELLASRKSDLQKAKARISSIRSRMKGGGVPSFIRALTEIDGGARKKLSAAQRLAITSVANTVRGNPEFTFDPDRVLFIPHSSWLRGLFKFWGHASGMTLPLQDDNHAAPIIIIDSDLQDPLEVSKCLIHEIVHAKYHEGRRLMVNTRPEEAWMYRILNEAATENRAIELMTDVLSKNPALRPYTDKYADKELAGIIRKLGVQKEYQEVIAMKIFRTYTAERATIGSMSKSAPDAQVFNDAMELYLTTGDSTGISRILGKAWKGIVDIAETIEDGSHRRYLYLTGLHIILSSMKHADPAPKLLAGRLVLDAWSDALGEIFDAMTEIDGYDMRGADKYEARAAVRIFDETIKDDTLDISTARSRRSVKAKLIKKIAQYSAGEVKKEHDAALKDKPAGTGVTRLLKALTPQMNHGWRKSVRAIFIAPIVEEPIFRWLLPNLTAGLLGSFALSNIIWGVVFIALHYDKDTKWLRGPLLLTLACWFLLPVAAMDPALYLGIAAMSHFAINFITVLANESRSREDRYGFASIGLKTPKKDIYVSRPLANPDIIDPRGIKNILVFDPEEGLMGPKLGESIINAWPLMAALTKKYKDATIYVVTDFPDIYFSEQFGGKVRPVPTSAISGLIDEGGNKWKEYNIEEWSGYTLQSMKEPEVVAQFLVDKKIDLVFDLYKGFLSGNMEPVFSGIKPQMFENGTMPYIFTLFPATKLFSGTRREFISGSVGRLITPVVTDRQGERYLISGMDKAIEDIDDAGMVDDAGIWRLSISTCRAIGLDIDRSSLGVLEPNLKERNAALAILKEWHDRASGGTAQFDPLKKIFIINVYGVSHPDIISNRAWSTIISRLLKETDAYLIFTHGGKMDIDVNKIDDILKDVVNPSPNRILLPRQELYPAITSVMAVADWVLTPDTGLSHLASGVYNKPTCILTTGDITHWLTPRSKTAKPVFVDNPYDVVTRANVEYARYHATGIGSDFLDSVEGQLYKEVIEKVLVEARAVDRRPMRPAVLSGRLSALSITGRAELEREAVEDARQKGLEFPGAAEDLRKFVASYLDMLGYDHRLMPEIVFVDTASQMGIDVPRFMVKLHWGESATILLIDKSALARKDDGSWTVLDNVKKFEVLHEVLGHMFVRSRYPEFEAVSRRAIRDGHESTHLLMTKTEEEILARILTFMAYKKIKDIAPAFKNEIMETRMAELGLSTDLADMPLFLTAIVKTILSTDDDLNIHKYRKMLENDKAAGHIIDKVAAKMRVLVPADAGTPEPQAPAAEKPVAGLMAPQDAMLRAILQVLQNVRAPEDRRVFFIPYKGERKPYDDARADLKYALEKEGFRNVRIALYDGTVSDLERARAAESDMLNDPNALALAIVDQAVVDEAALKNHNERDNKCKWIRENVPNGVAAEELFMQVAFGLPVLDFVKNSASAEHRQKLLEIIEKLVDNSEQDLKALKADFNTIFVGSIIIALKKITKIDINAEMHKRERTLTQVLTAA